MFIDLDQFHQYRERSKTNKMRTMKLAVLAVALIAVLASAGCSKRSVLSVNGEKISRAEFQTRLERLQIPTGANTPSRQAGELVMNTLVNEKLILQLAKDKKVEPTEAQINEKIELAKKEGNLSEVLKQRRMDMDEFKRELTLTQAFRNVVTKGIKVEESEVKKTYDGMLAAKTSPLKQPEQVLISLIHCKEKSKIDEASKMLKGGMDFVTVALRMSEDASAQQGGEVGAVYRDDPRQVPKEIWQTAFNLKVNTVSDPVRISDDDGVSWYIIKNRAHKKAKTKSYADVKELLREELALRKAAEKGTDFNKMLEDFRKESEINVKMQRYKDLVQTGKDKSKDTKDKEDEKKESEEEAKE